MEKTEILTTAIVTIITALITAGFPMLTTIITNGKIKKQSAKQASRQTILQLIIEDKISVMEGKLPQNYQSVLEEFDNYLTNGGNSYVHHKVDEYKEWYSSLTKKG